MQIELASHLKRQRCENCKENTNVELYIKKLILTLITPEQTKVEMSLRLKKVCPVYKTYPITELKLIFTLITPEQTKVSKYWTCLSD